MLHKKIMLLGDIGVGKSSIARRLVFDRFEVDYKTTIGVDLFAYDVPRADAAEAPAMRLSIWDTDGDFGQSIFQTVYVRGAAGAVVVADLTRPTTLESMESLTAAFMSAFPGRPLIAVINKADLGSSDDAVSVRERFISTGDGVFITSAMSGQGIAGAFQAIADAIGRRRL